MLHLQLNRWMIALGGIVSAACFTAVSFGTMIGFEWMTVSIMLLGGFGLSMTMFPAIIIINNSFKKRVEKSS